MTTNWDPKIHTPSKIHPEGWALLIVFCAVVAFVIYLFVGTPA
jgi:hypothetical protein